MAGPRTGLSAMELDRQARIEFNKRRMVECGLVDAVQEVTATQQATAAARAAASSKPRRPMQYVEIPAEDLRRSGRHKQDVNYNEQVLWREVEALERPHRRTVVVRRGGGRGGGGRGGGGGGGGGRRPVRGWHHSYGVAGYAAADKCSEAAQAKVQALLPNPAFVKVMTPSMVSGGFWCNAPLEMHKHMGIGETCDFCVYPPEGQAVPQDATYCIDARTSWVVVYHFRGGFSGNWRGLAIDHKLFPNDCVVLEVLPQEEHERRWEGTVLSEEELKRRKKDPVFSVVMHVFRALDFEAEGERAARLAQMQAVQGEEEGEEGADGSEGGKGGSGEGAEANPEGSPAAVDAAAAEVSADGAQREEEEEVQGDGEVEAGPASPKRKRRQAKLTDDGAKRQERAGRASGGAAGAAGKPAASSGAAEPAERREEEEEAPMVEAVQAAPAPTRCIEHEEEVEEAPMVEAAPSASKRRAAAAVAGEDSLAGSSKRVAQKAPTVKKAGQRGTAAKRKARKAVQEEEAEQEEGQEEESQQAGQEQKGGAEEEEEGCWDVESIQAVKGRGKQRKVLIKWVGYEEPTWEPATMLDLPLHTYTLAPGLKV